MELDADRVPAVCINCRAILVDGARLYVHNQQHVGPFCATCARTLLEATREQCIKFVNDEVKAITAGARGRIQ
jgi:hypothetical protein